MTERVLVVERDAFFGGDWPQGFVPIAADARAAFLDAAWQRGRFVDRPLAEATPAWKQWIPYCVLTCGAGDGGDALGADGAGGDTGVFVVRRTKGTSEARLHGAWSIGLGGHVGPEDAGDGAGPADGAAFFAGSLARELREELDVRAAYALRPEFLGLLNDDSTEVGRVHAGLVFRAHVPLPVAAAAANVGIREICKMQGGFTHLVDFFKLWLNPPQFETWSQVLVRAGIADPIGGCPISRTHDLDG